MDIRYLKHENENGQEERFYPVTHAKAIVYGDDDKAILNNLEAHLDDTNNPHEVDCKQIGAVPVERTVNGKELSGDITLSAEDVGARPNTWMPTAGDVGAIPIALKGQAIYCDDLFAKFEIPTLVYWGGNTKNTPHTAGFTQGAEGFAIVTGDLSGWHSVLAWQKGGDRAYMWMHTVDGGIDHGWHDMTAYLPLTGGTVSGNMVINKGVPSLNFSIPDTNANAVLFKNTSSTTDYGTSLRDASTNGKQIELRLSGDEQAAQIVKKSSSSDSYKYYNILDSGNYYDYVGANKNLTFIGTNPIASTANDTTANWAAQGTGHAFYSTNGYLNGQPSQYGVLVNFVYANEVFQLFNQQAYGGLNYRSGNSTGWDGTSQTTNSWRKIYDTGNIQKGTWSITSGSTLATDYIYLQYE